MVHFSVKGHENVVKTLIGDQLMDILIAEKNP